MNENPSFYGILEAQRELENLETLPEEEKQVYFNALVEQKENKIEGTLRVIREAEMSAEMCDVDIKRLTERKQYFENRAKRIKEYLTYSMERFNITKIETPFAKLYFKPSESLVVVDEQEIPEDYIQTKEVKKVNKIALKKAIKDGLTVTGAYIERKNNLQLK